MFAFCHHGNYCKYIISIKFLFILILIEKKKSFSFFFQLVVGTPQFRLPNMITSGLLNDLNAIQNQIKNNIAQIENLEATNYVNETTESLITLVENLNSANIDDENIKIKLTLTCNNLKKIFNDVANDVKFMKTFSITVKSLFSFIEKSTKFYAHVDNFIEIVKKFQDDYHNWNDDSVIGNAEILLNLEDYQFKLKNLMVYLDICLTYLPNLTQLTNESKQLLEQDFFMELDELDRQIVLVEFKKQMFKVSLKNHLMKFNELVEALRKFDEFMTFQFLVGADPTYNGHNIDDIWN